MITAIITKGLATLREIREYYGMGDVWDMYEILAVSNYNEFVANQRD